MPKILYQNLNSDSCRRGHIMSESNTYTDPRGRVECRQCRKLRAEINFKQWYEKRKVNNPDWRRKSKSKVKAKIKDQIQELEL